MAAGYWKRFYYARCRDCASGPKDKFWCESCDHVCKAPHDFPEPPKCPLCRQPMVNMGQSWRPGKKGKRSFAHSPKAYRANWRVKSPGEQLLTRLNRSQAQRKLLTWVNESR